MRLSKTIVIATTNKGKFMEFRQLLEATPELQLVPANEFIRNADKLQNVEQFETTLENAVAKARLANRACHYPCLADDSALEVESLGGKPGVHTRRYAVPRAGQSQDLANIEKLLEELRGKSGDARKARFIASLALEMEGMLLHSTGVLEGTIAEEPRGKEGFGFDPVFIPKGSERTLGEMEFSEKNAISHRSRALADLLKQMRSKGIILARP